jgi:predicted O-methyltransferase YrrM
MNLNDIKTREDFPLFLNSNNLYNNWIELGVCQGLYSFYLLENSSCSKLYSVDMWAGDRNHDENQYNETVKYLSKFKERSKIVRKKFNEAVELFPDEYFDFVFIDGYAHTAQDNGSTLQLYWPKLKKGGLFAGHDYDKEFPDNIKAINEFCQRIHKPFNVTKEEKYPSFYLIK